MVGHRVTSPFVHVAFGRTAASLLSAFAPVTLASPSVFTGGEERRHRKNPVCQLSRQAGSPVHSLTPLLDTLLLKRLVNLLHSNPQVHRRYRNTASCAKDREDSTRSKIVTQVLCHSMNLTWCWKPKDGNSHSAGELAGGVR